MKLDSTLRLRQRLCGDLLRKDKLQFTSLALYEVQASGLLEDRSMTWAAWDDSRYRKRGDKTVLGHSLNWLRHRAEDTRKARPWLWLYSQKYGVGKTHLAAMLSVHWIAVTETPAKLISWSRFLQSTRDSFGSDVKPAVYLEELIEIPFLVLDDLACGRSWSSQWATEQLESLIDGRKSRNTVITANYEPESFIRALRNADNTRNWSRTDVINKLIDRLGRGRGGSVAVMDMLPSTGSYRQEMA